MPLYLLWQHFANALDVPETHVKSANLSLYIDARFLFLFPSKRKSRSPTISGPALYKPVRVSSRTRFLPLPLRMYSTGGSKAQTGSNAIKHINNGFPPSCLQSTARPPPVRVGSERNDSLGAASGEPGIIGSHEHHEEYESEHWKHHRRRAFHLLRSKILCST